MCNNNFVRRIFFALTFLFLATPVFAQSCNTNSSWLLQHGTINVGDTLVYGPGCGQVQDGGNTTGTGFVLISGATNLTSAFCQQYILYNGAFSLVSFPSPVGISGCLITLVNGNQSYLSGGRSITVAIQNENLATPWNTVAASPPTDYLYPGQSISLKSDGVNWQWVSFPGRWLVPGALTLNIDTSLGLDTNDGLAAGAGNALKTIQRCYTLIMFRFDFRIAPQPTCLGAAGEIFVENIQAAFPALGTNTVNLNLQGSTLRNGGAGPTLLHGNGLNLQLSQTVLDNTGTSCLPACVSIQQHNAAVKEDLASVTCGLHGSQGVCFGSDQNTAGPHTINVDNGITLQASGATQILGDVIRCLFNCTVNFNGAITNVGNPVVGELFQGQFNSSFQLAGNVSTIGAYGNTPRMVSLTSLSTFMNFSGPSPLTGTSAAFLGIGSLSCTT